jgi:hypothetical protein
MAGRHRVGALAVAVLTLACGDASTAPPQQDDSVVVSVGGLGADAAGVVLRVTGSLDRIDAAHASLEVAWARGDATTATVAIVGPVGQLGDLLVVRRTNAVVALGAEVVEVADGAGSVSLPATAHAIVKNDPLR